MRSSTSASRSLRREPRGGGDVELAMLRNRRVGFSQPMLYQMGTLLHTIRDAGGRTGVTCTPESARAVGDLADYWIVAYRSYTPDVRAAAAPAGAHAAIYANFAMMGQNTYAPRFLFGYFVWANGLRGILPWTYPAQRSLTRPQPGSAGVGARRLQGC
jgi:hypothetical protein